MKLYSPLSVPQSKTKNFILNLNVYRNAHYQTLNKAKVTYKEYMRPQIEQIPNREVAYVRYTLFPKTKRLCDVGNVCAIQDKFFMDSLVELGKLPDDNYLYQPEALYRFGEIDPQNPRVEIELFDKGFMPVPENLEDLFQ